jgi:AcrR family transcriptional regulator
MQERSAATVDAILQAAAYILVRHGWEGFNTNRVAERAGVNIASLYQYFPSKEAIVVELQRRHVAKAREAFPLALEMLRSQRTLKAALELVVRAAVDEHRVAPGLHRVFAEELPRSARRAVQATDDGGEQQWRALLEPFLRNVPDPELAMFVARVVLHAVVHEAATEHPGLLAHPELAREVVILLDAYLRRPNKKGARAAPDE